MGLSPSAYGGSFIAIAIAAMMGSMWSKKLHAHHPSQRIMNYGLRIIVTSTVVFSSIALVNHSIYQFPNYLMIASTIISQMVVMFGICLAANNAMALALVDYKWCIGTASSLFGFFYYCLISLFTLGMGVLHNGTLLPMPLYFFGIAVFMVIVQKIMLRRS